jgi:putative SOS response-associated peptidase YedK
VTLARWGLVPFFIREMGKSNGLSTINAPAESIEAARILREPLKKRRCLVRLTPLPVAESREDAERALHFSR